MHNGFVHSTGNNFLNPFPVSTWAPSFPFWGVDFDPSNQLSWLGLADYAYASIRNVFGANPVSKLTVQQVGQAAARQTASLGTRGVDLAMLERRLFQGAKYKGLVPSGQLLGRVAAPLYFAETLGGSTPSPSMAQEMINQPLTPPSVTSFLQNLFGVTPTIPTQTRGPTQVPQFQTRPQQQPTPGGRQPFLTTRANRGPRYLGLSRGGSGARRL